MSRGGKIFLGIVLGIMLGLYGLFKYHFPAYSWNQKLTVEVETPDGLVTGSAVTRVIWKFGPPKLSVISHPSVGYALGDATVVDLGDGRYLFAPLRGAGSNPVGEPPRYIVKEFFRTGAGPLARDVVPDVYRRRGLASGVITLSPDNYPLLVRFDELNDPASVKKVDPNNLAASFGEGFKLKRITVEVTSENVTKGIVLQILPWLKKQGGRQFDGKDLETSHTDNRFANSLNAYPFFKGD